MPTTCSAFHTALPDDLVVHATELRDGLGSFGVTDLPEPVLAAGAPAPPEASTPLERRWWQWAVHDIAGNLIDGRYFGAGRSFGPTVFTRDLSLSGVLALNALYPAAMWSSLRFDRELRFRVDWRVIAASSAPETTGLPFESTAHDYDSFVTTYHTAEFARRTDDVVWLWAAMDWLTRHGKDDDDWQWAYETGRECFRRYYDAFRDPADGLYRGQACFLDIMMCGYQSLPALEDPRDAPDFLIHHVDDPGQPAVWRPDGRVPASLRRSMMGKAASTNALYVLGLQAMAAMARRLELSTDAAAWSERARDLTESFRREFLRPDGAVRFLKECDGTWNERQHALGTALAILASILEGSQAQRALAALPVTWRGVPLLDPFYTDHAHCYHNLSTWPFADGLVHLAALRAGLPEEPVRQRWRALCGRACRDERGFRELADARTGQLLGSGHQLWSAAAYCGSWLPWNVHIG